MVHPYRWLRPDLVPPAPFLQCQPHLTPGGSGVLAGPAKIGEEFRKAWLPYFLPLWANGYQPQEFDREVDGWWGWRELKVLPVSWYDELARILSKVEDTGVWLDGLLDAYIAMIPKTEGDATSLGQRLFTVLPVVYRILGLCSYGSA